MREVEVKGPNFNLLTYDGGKMRIHFYDGTITEYHHVPEGIFEGATTSNTPGTYLRKYVSKKYNYTIVQDMEMKRLRHFRDSSVGLWVTDKVSAIPEDKKDLFWQLTDDGDKL